MLNAFGSLMMVRRSVPFEMRLLMKDRQRLSEGGRKKGKASSIKVAPIPPEEALRQLESEGLFVVKSDNSSGFRGVQYKREHDGSTPLHAACERSRRGPIHAATPGVVAALINARAAVDRLRVLGRTVAPGSCSPSSEQGSRHWVGCG